MLLCLNIQNTSSHETGFRERFLVFGLTDKDNLPQALAQNRAAEPVEEEAVDDTDIDEISSGVVVGVAKAEKAKAQSVVDLSALEFDFNLSNEELIAFAKGDKSLREDYGDEFLDRVSKMSEEEQSGYGGFFDSLRRLHKLPTMTKLEIEEAFSPENLEKLSLREYVDLLRRVPSGFATHVTRHGFRDKLGMHNSSGDKSFHRGLEGILSDGHVRSVLDQEYNGTWNEQGVKSVLKALGVTPVSVSKANALERVLKFLDNSGNGAAQSEYADNNAIHVAIDAVDHGTYGSEVGNQPFFYFPKAFIASQYNIALQTGVRALRNDLGSGFGNNDIWLMQKSDRRGNLPLGAGIVFLPANARVNPETGSKYATGKNGLQLEGNPLASEIVSSKEYWEKHFEEHGNRPARVVYFEGTPEEAMETFRIKTELPSSDELKKKVDLEPLFGKNETNQFGMRDALAEERAQFRAVAKRLIDEMY